MCYLKQTNKKVIIPNLQLAFHLLSAIVSSPPASLTSLSFFFFLFYPQPSSITRKAPLAHVHPDLPLALHSSGVHFLERANRVKFSLLLVP